MDLAKFYESLPVRIFHKLNKENTKLPRVGGFATLISHFTIKSNQIIFIGLRSSKGYYKRPGGGVGIWEGSLGHEFLRGSMRAEGMVMGGSGLDEYFGEQTLPVESGSALRLYPHYENVASINI